MTPTVSALLGFACCFALLIGATMLSEGNITGVIPLVVSIVAAFIIGVGQGDDL